MTDPQATRRAALRTLVEECIELTEREGRGATERLLQNHPSLAEDARAQLQKLGDRGLLDLAERFPEVEGYRVLEHVGHGGMGDIYLAESRGDLRMRVAVKVVKAGMDTREVLGRFEAERQALARMDHPNIARIHDAGATANGRPYFTMDYVPGLPITKFCEARQLGVEDRLRLMLDVCAAVQHAHHKGIIHRDLKPSNVLVSEQEGEIGLKVIDFGLAKAIHGPLTDTTLHTVQGMLLGTPEYMSPEQAGRDVLDVDTRTDIYSLGVILYEMLVGELPIQIDRANRVNPTELQLEIRDTPIDRPSVRVVKRLTECGSSSGVSGLQSRALGRALRGELDWLVLKALAKERQQRYSTPAELAAEIGRYLKGDPVMAGPPSRFYRARLFIRRHRWAVAVAGVALCSLAIGLVIALQQAAIASRERDTARSANASLQETVRFQRGMLARIDPRAAGINLLRQLRDTMSAATDTDGALAGLLEEFDKVVAHASPTDAARNFVDVEILAPALAEASLNPDKVVRAGLMDSIAHVYKRLGFSQKALDVFMVVVALRLETKGSAHPMTLDARTQVAATRLSLGEWATAAADLRGILNEQIASAGLDELATIVTRLKLALALERLTHHAAAEEQFRAVVEIYSRRIGPSQPETRWAKLDLATHLRVRGRLTEAEQIMRPALAEIRRDPEVAPLLVRYMTSEMGNLLYTMGRAAEAAELLFDALELSRQVDGVDHPSTVAAAADVVNAYRAVGKIAEARALAEDVVERSRRLLGDRHPQTLERQVQLASVLVALGQRDEAEQMLRTALAHQQVELSAEHAAVLRTTNLLAGVVVGQGRPQDAVADLRRVWAVGERVLGEGHPTRLSSGVSLAQALLSAGEREAALAQIAMVHAAADRLRGADHPITLRAVGVRAEIQHVIGKLADAEKGYRLAIEGMCRVGGSNNPMALYFTCELARLYSESDRLDEAEKLAHHVRERAGAGQVLVRSVEKLIADIARRRGQDRG